MKNIETLIQELNDLETNRKPLRTVGDHDQYYTQKLEILYALRDAGYTGKIGMFFDVQESINNLERDRREMHERLAQII